ncbi:hypothetical protein NPIL_217121, partial [Nephila pilipes]
ECDNMIVLVSIKYGKEQQSKNAHPYLRFLKRQYFGNRLFHKHKKFFSIGGINSCPGKGDNRSSSLYPKQK